MLKLPQTDKKILIALSLAFCLTLGVGFEHFYQPKRKTINIYMQALDSYNLKDYSNAYYQFSRVGNFSKLKPAALYRQALCAHALGDEVSEIEAYSALFKHFPASHLSTEAKYNAAKLLSDRNSKKALRYFSEVMVSGADEEYKVASQYYISKIEARNKKTKLKKEKIEEGFRNYLVKYPDGRLAADVARNWLKYNPKMKSSDFVLAGRAYYLAGLYNESEQILSKAKMNDAWALLASIAYKKGNIVKGNSLTIVGSAKYAGNVEKEDYNRAVSDYVLYGKNSYNSATELLKIAKGKYKDYIWNLKCKNSPQSSKYSCYEELYGTFPNGDYAQNAMLNTLIGRLINKNYTGAKLMTNDFITKYPDSEYLPMVMFWNAKIEQKYSHNPNFEIFYRNIINNFPNSYYAYRSFWIVENLPNSIIPTDLVYKPVEYPYKYPHKGSILYNLILVNDYTMIEKYANDDFIKSWAQYKNDNYVTSMLTAKKAMEKLKTKPPKDDARWRLVYPLNYFKQVQTQSSYYGNNPALIMAIIKEESHFNPYAQSGVGAIGLMQLMPQTAHEVGEKKGYQFNTTDLFNPEFNIRMGNIYYATLKDNLGGMDISAVAAYNGGIGSVTRWKDLLHYSDTDEFVEQIPYEETKNYVHKVMTSYWNYTRVYQK